MRWLRCAICAVSLLALAIPAAARAHALLPAALGMHEVGPAQYRGSFRRPPQLADALTPVFPSDCQLADKTTSREADQQVDHFTLTCRAGLAGRTLYVAGLVGVELSALVQVVHRDGAEARALLTPARPSFAVPRRATPWTVLGDYVRLGLTHLATGLDHVLFIAGLCLLVANLRRRILTLSAFTLGHSLTLCLAALDLVRLPQAPVEIAIAASLMVLAREVLRPSPHTPTASLAAAFGLLHGLGFASALAESGLAPKAVALSLLGFNLGIELGQLAVVLSLLPLGLVLRRAFDAKRMASMRTAAAYALGSLAAMWSLERALSLVG
jgi:hydrogenase/urease accessory protein HupE